MTGILRALIVAVAPASPTIGVNVDFGSVPVYANIVRHCLWWNPANNPYASANVAVDRWNCPTVDFSLYIPIIETKRGPNGDTFPIRFEGRASLAALGGCTVSPVRYDPAANVTTATLTVAPNSDLALLGFNNTRRLRADTTATGIDARTLTIMRPLAPGSSQHHDRSEKWNRQLLVALAPFKGGYWRDLDTGIINNVLNLPAQTPANRTMPYSPIQTLLGPTRGVSWEDRIELANFLGMGLWNCFPDTGTPELFQLYLDIAKYGSDAAGLPYTGTTGPNPVQPGQEVHKPLAGRLLWEESNEIWNTFHQNTRIAAAGMADYGSLNANREINPGQGPTLDPLFCRNAARLLAHADMAKAAFPGGLGLKYFPVFCSQSGNMPTRDQGMTWLKRRLAARGETIAQNIAACGGDGYENMLVNLGDSGQTVATALAGGLASNSGIAADGVAAAAYGVDYASYECGAVAGDNPLGLAVAHDPRFRAMVRDRVLNMVACRCRFITCYTLIRGNTWSILDSIHDLSHPKYLGWVDALAHFPADGSAGLPLPTPAAPAFADASFEQTRIDAVAAGFAYQPGGAWTYTASAGVNGPTTGFINQGQPILHGTQVGFLQGTGSIAQTVAGWPAGPCRITGRMNARLKDGTLSFDVLVDGAVVGTFKPTPTTNFSTFATGPITVAAGSHTVAFRTTSGQDLALLIDDVAIVPPSTAAEPATNRPRPSSERPRPPR